MFEFNGNYRDLEQVRPWLSEFARIREQITTAGGYPHNDAFKGRIPGIGNSARHAKSAGTHEDAAIYLLQGLYRAEENRARISSAREAGCVELTTLDRVTKYGRVIVYDDQDRMRGPIWSEFEDARVVPNGHGQPDVVLMKGRRRRGTAINGRHVMVSE